VLLGSLPFTWRKAEVARNVIYDRLELREGDKVLIIGECIEPCGFIDDIRARIGPRGEIKVFDITARRATTTSPSGAAVPASSPLGSGPIRATFRTGHSIARPACRACSTPTTRPRAAPRCCGHEAGPQPGAGRDRLQSRDPMKVELDMHIE
jgi:hypothetical protein